MAGQYRIPKQRIPVRVWFENRDDVPVHFFAGAHAESHRGSERPSDLLESSVSFLAVENECGEIELVRKKSIWMVTVAAEIECGDETWDAPDPETGEAERSELVVTLDDGSQIRGAAHYRLPHAGQRLQDFLNRSGSFLQLVQGDRTAFINMDRISRVSEPAGEAEVE